MALSNYIPSSRVMQPGVCTSSTRPASPYEGMVIYETDTNRVLIWDNAAWVMIADTDTPPGLQLIKKATTVSSGNIEVLDCFSSEFEAYKIIFSNIVSNTALTAEFDLYTGSAWTSNGFYATRTHIALGTTTFSGVIAANNAATCSLGMVPDTTPSGGWIEIQNPYLAVRTTFQFGGSDSRTTGNGSIYGSGVHGGSTSFTGFRLRGAGGGNLTSGTVCVYGYRNSI